MIADHQIKKDQDAIMAEYLEKFRKAHEAKVETKYGNTYVSFEQWDTVSEERISKLKLLFKLMDIDYSVRMVKYSQLEEPSGNEFTFTILDGNAKIEAFIKKFVENGYRLTY